MGTHGREPSTARYHYYLLRKYDFSHLRKVYFLKTKVEIFGCIKDYIPRFRNETGKKIFKIEQKFIIKLASNA